VILNNKRNLTWLAWSAAVVCDMAAAGRVRNRGIGSSADFLFRCRGDEAREAYDEGESVDDYVSFLKSVDEYDGDTGWLDPEQEL
jgi:hypothetical protein